MSSFNAIDFKWQSVMLIPTSGSAVDIKDVVMQYDVYEDIATPYCTGSILIGDQTGWLEKYKFKGTERLIITVVCNTANTPDVSGTTITKKWHVHTAEQVEKTGDGDSKSTIWVLGLIDEHASASKATKFSEAIGDGTKLEDEISSICQDKLGKNVKKKITSSVQTNWKAVVPYMHPLEACEWLRDRASTGSGMPFLLYASAYDDNLRLSTLDKLQEQPPFNGTGVGNAFLYSASQVQADELDEFGVRHKQIGDINVSNLSKTFEQIMSGTCGGSYGMVELDKGIIEGWIPKHYTITDPMGAIPKDGIQNIYDPMFSMQGVGPAHSADSRFIYQTLNRKTYRPGGNYKSIHWEADADSHINKVKTLACLDMMMKNCFEITVSGRDVVPYGVGDRINCMVPEDGDETRTGFAQLFSGVFLITNVKHSFTREVAFGAHRCTMTITKFNEGGE